MPRSLRPASADHAGARPHRGQSDHAVKRLANEMHVRPTHADIEEIFQGGLHEYLTGCLKTSVNWATASSAPTWDPHEAADPPRNDLPLPMRRALLTQYLRLMLRDTARQKVRRWKSTPEAPVRTHDGYGNVPHVLTLDTRVRRSASAPGHGGTSPALDAPSDFTGFPCRRCCSCAPQHSHVAGKLAVPRRVQGRIELDCAGLRDLAAAIREKMPFERMNCPSRRAPRRCAAATARARTRPGPCSLPAPASSAFRRAMSRATLHARNWRASRPGAGWKPDRAPLEQLRSGAQRTDGEGHVKLAMATPDARPIRGLRRRRRGNMSSQVQVQEPAAHELARCYRAAAVFVRACARPLAVSVDL